MSLLSRKYFAGCLWLLSIAGGSQAGGLAERLPWEQGQGSIRDLGASACLPCHYPGVPSGTDLKTLICTLPTEALRVYLERMMDAGNMPPDPSYRHEYRVLLGRMSEGEEEDPGSRKLHWLCR